jgi:[acyl-carrier-protein] S-malonyltransferase
LRWWSAAAGVDLVEIGTEADAETIRDTALAQPLIVAAGLLAAEALAAGLLGTGLLGAGALGTGLLGTGALGSPLDNDDNDGGGARNGTGPASGALPSAVVLAGHSVGEITAGVLAGILSAEAALTFTAARGRAMAAAAAREPTGMSALLGGDPDEVAAHLEAVGLTPANRNGAGQIVAAGAVDALERLAASPPAGTRVRPLPVAGAFHTRYMEPGRDALAAIAPGLRPRNPAVRLLSNADGTTLTSGAEAVARLVSQVASPVRWDLCLAALRDAGVTGVLELPPAGTLAGIARRELKGADIVALKTPADLPAARSLIAAHAGPTVPSQPGPRTGAYR